MVGLIFRLFLGVLLLAGMVILFAYAFIAALIVTPFLLLFLYLMGRRMNKEWEVVQRETRARSGPVIDHDPNDLPPHQ
jgi:hypothetical protein